MYSPKKLIFLFAVQGGFNFLNNFKDRFDFLWGAIFEQVSEFLLVYLVYDRYIWTKY